jgi:hypothetical protein
MMTPTDGERRQRIETSTASTELAPLPVPRPWWRRPGGLLLAAVVVGSFLFWIYALSGLAKRDPIDRFGDTAFPRGAEPICRAAMDRLDRLPFAISAETPAERADTVEEANAILAAMVAELARIAPSGGADGELARAWLADWDDYLRSRVDYAERVRDDPRARFLLGVRDGQSITKPMDNVAAVNRMPACRVPDDVG